MPAKLSPFELHFGIVFLESYSHLKPLPKARLRYLLT